MRIYPDTILDIISSSALNLNNISKLSGVSNTYLTKLSKKQINHPGKDKITSILLALNYTIAEINQILAEYDYQSLNKFDIPNLLVNNRRRKLEGRMLPVYERLNFELLLTVFEHFGGDRVLIKSRPSGVYQPYSLYMQREFQNEVKDDVARFQYDLTAAIVRERLDLFRENAPKGDKVTQYICHHCLDEDINKCLNQLKAKDDIFHLRLYAQYWANAVSCAVKFPEQHKLHIVERCPCFEVLIQGTNLPKPKVNFIGVGPHIGGNSYDQHDLRGFFTDSSATLELFNLEVQMCVDSINPEDERNTPEGLHAYISEHFKKQNVGHLFDEAFEEAMAFDGLFLF
ncbi:hypothetical protein ACXJY6_01280 [Vibrio sp. RC27]